jgi:outer membrane protein OmpA-like peptidoglycan-associated protein
MHTKKIFSLLTVASASLLALPAVAQMYPGEDVIVNPAAIPGPMFQPGQSSSTYTVHKPHHHRPHPVVAKADVPPPAEATAEAAPTADTPPPITSDNSLPVAPPPPAKPAKHTHHTAAAAQATEASTGGLGFSFGEDEAPAPPPPPPPANTRTASNEPPAAQAEKPSKADAQQANLAKRGAILFEHSSTDPQPSQMDGIKLLAGDLNSALEAGATQIQLQAFGGAPGDKGSEAKRISLRRALAIRQLLIDNGVPSAKIVTRAMGGATDGGEADRVDIYVRAS